MNGYNNIKKTLYNSGKSFYDELFDSKLRLDYYQSTSNSLGSILDDFASVEKFVFNIDTYGYQPIRRNWVDEALSLLSEKITFNISDKGNFPRNKSRICEISNELRLIRKDIRRKGYIKNLVTKINDLILELNSLIKHDIHKTKVYIKNINKTIFSSLVIDFRKRFRTIVINLCNCFNDCSISDDEDNSNAFGERIRINHLINNNHVQQKVYYQVFRINNRE